MLVGTVAPGVSEPMSFGKVYPIAVDTVVAPRPSLLAIALIVVGSTARLTCCADKAGASAWPSQDVASVPRPADLALSRKPPMPPGRAVTMLRTSRTSGPAFGPSPNRPEISPMSASNWAMFSSLRIWVWHVQRCQDDGAIL